MLYGTQRVAERSTRGGNEADCLIDEPGVRKIPPETTTLDDTSKFCMEFDHLILRKIIKFVATRMSDFMAKMHQIRRRLRLCHRPRYWSLQRSPRVRSWINGPYLLSVCRAASA